MPFFQSFPQASGMVGPGGQAQRPRPSLWTVHRWSGGAGSLEPRGDAVRLFWMSSGISHLPFRISYCTADKMHGKVFAYIAQSQHNENLECHAFLCTKRKMVSGERPGLGQALLALAALSGGKAEPR